MKIATRLSNNRDVMDEIYGKVDSHESELRSAIGIMLADDEDNYKNEWGGTMVHDSINSITRTIACALYSGIQEVTSCYFVAEKDELCTLVVAKLEKVLDPKVITENLAERLASEEFSVTILGEDGSVDSSTCKLSELLTEENLKLLEDTVSKTYAVLRTTLIKQVKDMFGEDGLLSGKPNRERHLNPVRLQSIMHRSRRRFPSSPFRQR